MNMHGDNKISWSTTQIKSSQVDPRGILAVIAERKRRMPLKIETSSYNVASYGGVHAIHITHQKPPSTEPKTCFAAMSG